ncbi:response regulator [Pseudoalteromonas sp.]|uniref:response regulator n=1 Tax=Pseudoalteromonas sp. TaxID=53249 RepID=UPI0035674C6F
MDELLFAANSDEIEEERLPWKVLIVDDEKDIHSITTLALGGFKFDGRPLSFLHAYSGKQAQEILTKHPDIAMMFLDVVMETEDAGLNVVLFCRESIKNNLVRIILRTGEPGSAPQMTVMQQYDINDYKNKTEITSDKLRSVIVSSLRSYQELLKLSSIHHSLSNILQFNQVLLQLTNRRDFLSHLLSELNHLLPLSNMLDNSEVKVTLVKRTLKYFEPLNVVPKLSIDEQWINSLNSYIDQVHFNNLYNNTDVLLYLYCCQTGEEVYLVLKYQNPISGDEQLLLESLAYNMVIACNNVWLNESLSEMNDELESKVIDRTKELSIANQKAEQANVAKSQFLANMSHEIRTPMNAILGFTQIISHSDNLSAEHRVNLDKIKKAGEHLLDIINDVLEISKIEAGAMLLKPSIFDLIALCEEITQMLQLKCEQKGLLFQFDNQLSSRYIVNSDQGKLKQILINLIGNSVKFTERGRIVLRLSRVDNAILFEIEDSGLGIAEEELTSLFSNFSQGKAGHEKGGTGLGLAISAKQVELLGGKLEVWSKLSVGSKFYFQLQFERANDVEFASKKELRKISLRPQCNFMALIVDDNKDNRDVLAGLLQSCNIEYQFACNGQEALQALQSGCHFDIAFIDLLMPVMRGDELIIHIRNSQDFSQLKCIAISAFSLSHEIQSFLDLGFDQFIAKPYLFSDIFQSIVTMFPDLFDVEYQSPVIEEEINESAPVIFTLSTDLEHQIIQAADMNRLSFVRTLINDNALNHPANAAGADYLLKFIDNYDMEGLLAALEEIKDVN